MDLFGIHSRRRLELERWAAGRAIHLPGLEAADPGRLAPLDGMLRGKRLVYLGEADHFVHEVFTFRLLLLRYLVPRGFRWLAAELGACDGFRIDRFLETGDERWLTRLPSFGDASGARPDRDDRLSGPLAAGAYPLESMRAEHAELARRVRAITPERVHWQGLDGDNAPGGAYEDLGHLLAGGGAETRAVRRLLERVTGESLDDEVARLGAVLELLAAPAAAQELGTAAQAQARRSLVSLRAGLVFVRDSRGAKTWTDLAGPMARRERVMIENARSVVAAVPPGEGLVLMGHAAHLSKDWPSARRLDTSAGPGAVSLGTQLAREHPGEVLSIWLLHGTGRDSQPLESLPRELSSPPGSLNAALASLGDCFLLPLGDPATLPSLLRGEREIRWIYGAGCRTRVARQADAIFFVREATPLRETPELR